MNSQLLPVSPRSLRAAAIPATWLKACSNEPVVSSIPGECSAPIISSVPPSVLNPASDDSASRPASISAT